MTEADVQTFFFSFSLTVFSKPNTHHCTKLVTDSKKLIQNLLEHVGMKQAKFPLHERIRCDNDKWKTDVSANAKVAQPKLPDTGSTAGKKSPRNNKLQLLI